MNGFTHQWNSSPDQISGTSHGGLRRQEPSRYHISEKQKLLRNTASLLPETIWQAKKKSALIYSWSNHTTTDIRSSAKINKIYLSYTDMVEPFSIDESWLDVTASQRLFGTGRQIADMIRARVKRELNLTLSVGVSYNKIFAKNGQ